ncbi:MAG: hypothetical protein JJU45_14400 [Acidimicrobiia bacterium]|nr:hypothetical protein [Acidimicrobiia bacterium]
MDPAIDQVGHDPRSSYVELFWLPVLGPTSTLLLRRLADGLEDEPEGFDVDLAAASRALGLGGHVTRHGPLLRSVERCCTFGMAQQLDERLLVRRALPPLNQRQVGRLPRDLRLRHDALAQETAAAGVKERRRRARSLALTLVELGEADDDVERQLHRWRFHPAVAHDALRWARTEHSQRMTVDPIG